jgi:hypothetical protein
MKSVSYSIGTLVFATMVAFASNALSASQTPATLAAIGVVIGSGASVYFIRLIRLGDLFRFTAEAWLAGAVCYLLLVLIVSALALDRQGMLSSMTAWAATLSTSVIPRAVSLCDLGASILTFSFAANLYLGRRT